MFIGRIGLECFGWGCCGGSEVYVGLKDRAFVLKMASMACSQHVVLVEVHRPFKKSSLARIQ